jgi:hypothetical protein
VTKLSSGNYASELDNGKYFLNIDLARKKLEFWGTGPLPQGNGNNRSSRRLNVLLGYLVDVDDVNTNR